MMIQTSNKDEKFAQIAMEEARKSMLLSQHGCVAVYNGQVIARGHNTYQCTSKDGFLDNCCTCHAEINVLRQLYNQHCRIISKSCQKKINKKKKQKKSTNNQFNSDESGSSDDDYESPEPFTNLPQHRSHESRPRRHPNKKSKPIPRRSDRSNETSDNSSNTYKNDFILSSGSSSTNLKKDASKSTNMSFLSQCERLCFQPKKPKIVCGT